MSYWYCSITAILPSRYSILSTRCNRWENCVRFISISNEMQHQPLMSVRAIDFGNRATSTQTIVAPYSDIHIENPASSM